MKRKPKPVPEGLTKESMNRFYHWHRGKWPHHFLERSVRVTWLVNEVEACLDWHRARENPNDIVDFEAAARTWMRKSMEKRGYEPYVPPSSATIPRGMKPFERKSTMPEPIQGTLLRILQ